MSDRKAVTDVPAVRGPRHGMMALKAQIRIKGLGAIDRRTAAARSLITWRRELVSDLGGDTAVTAAQRALVDVAVRTRLLLDHTDAHLLSMPKLVNRRNRLIPLVAQRQRLADLLTRVLAQLGLDRRTPPSHLADLLATQNGPQHGGA
jgi:hypothetical protein